MKHPVAVRFAALVIVVGTLAFAGCSTGANAIRADALALELLNGIEVATSITFEADSVCTNTWLRHPIIPDSVALYRACWPYPSDGALGL